MPGRRRFCSATVNALLALSAGPATSAALTVPRWQSDPFTLGVASGNPRADRVVLWTRLAPRPLEPEGGMDPATIAVEWELAADDQMRNIVRRGMEYATPQWAHSIHAEVLDLAPATTYWYRFRSGDAVSPVGRTRTAPDPRSPNTRLRIASCSCQHYEHGFYGAYAHMLRDDPDLVVHLGDYIYEVSFGADPVRHHQGPESHTLTDYRTRYAQYKQDRDLQAMHQHAPWLVTWDDHEVANDYADLVSEYDDDPQWFAQRRAAAYRAYYEHMPLPRQSVPFGPAMKVYGDYSYGQLARICLLDGRQYRSPHPCPAPGKRGGNTVSSTCAGLRDPAQTMLGPRQENWLNGRLASPRRARWNIIAQQTVMAYLDEDRGPDQQFWTDGWNGYPQARQRLLDGFTANDVSNPVVLSGDIHAFIASNLHQTPADPASPAVACEITATSITSNARTQDFFENLAAGNPATRFVDGAHRGYARLDFTQESLSIALVGLDDARRADSPARVLKQFTVEAGRPGLIDGA
ncbi:MAG: alkaline phosphatase D family protein [Gammaproteobacteria bacterium]|nr:alkaline phosphatase D family protein [Gammaproteobacteria bacterium]